MLTRAPQCLVMHFLSVDGKLCSTWISHAKLASNGSAHMQRPFPIHGRTDMYYFRRTQNLGSHQNVKASESCGSMVDIRYIRTAARWQSSVNAMSTSCKASTIPCVMQRHQDETYFRSLMMRDWLSTRLRLGSTTNLVVAGLLFNVVMCTVATQRGLLGRCRLELGWRATLVSLALDNVDSDVDRG
jgi:hypothetical protein